MADQDAVLAELGARYGAIQISAIKVSDGFSLSLVGELSNIARDALAHARSLAVATPPTDERAGQPVDERAEFEKWLGRRSIEIKAVVKSFMFDAWRARASLPRSDAGRRSHE